MNEKRYTQKLIESGMYNFRDKKNAVFNHASYMMSRTLSMFEWQGLPDSVNVKMLELYLQTGGFVCVGKYKEELYAFTGGLGGDLDGYYQPKTCIVTNPWLNYDHTFEQGKDGVIIKNDIFYRGLLPLFNRYASQLVENEISLYMASINTRIQQALVAGDDRARESAEKFLEKLLDGDIGILADNAFLDNENIKTLPYGTTTHSGVIGDLIEYEQYIKASWFNELGLNANYNMKREALNSAESSINDDILNPLVDDMLFNRKQGADQINKLFGLDVSVELSSSWKQNKKEQEVMLKDQEQDKQKDDSDSDKKDDPEGKGKENEDT